MVRIVSCRIVSYIDEIVDYISLDHVRAEQRREEQRRKDKTKASEYEGRWGETRSAFVPEVLTLCATGQDERQSFYFSSIYSCERFTSGRVSPTQVRQDEVR